ncbi:MAG: methylated-DNA--[protein]-cysteine S-methyltransferase [Verrucomicrobiota bacterium]
MPFLTTSPRSTDRPAVRRSENSVVLTEAEIATPLGPMMVLAGPDRLRLLEFTDRRGLDGEIRRLRQRLGATIVPGRNDVTESIAGEVAAYFAGTLGEFRTPFALTGSPFQQAVWTELLRIPAGETRSYREVAEAVGGAHKVRAAAGAVGANQLAILIPCHRVIGSNGALTGYAGGLARKRWLLEHETGKK